MTTPTFSSSKPLTASDVVALSNILKLTHSGAKIVWVDPDDHDARQRRGVLRHVIKSPENFGFLNQDEDVRDGFIRITDWGNEIVLPVMKLAEMHRDGYLMEDD